MLRFLYFSFFHITPILTVTLLSHLDMLVFYATQLSLKSSNCTPVSFKPTFLCLIFFLPPASLSGASFLISTSNPLSTSTNTLYIISCNVVGWGVMYHLCEPILSPSSNSHVCICVLFLPVLLSIKFVRILTVIDVTVLLNVYLFLIIG